MGSYIGVVWGLGFPKMAGTFQGVHVLYRIT